MASTIRGSDNFDSSVVASKTSRGSVGSYALMYKVTGGFLESQADRSGSDLAFHNADTQGYTTLRGSGTWRCMGMIHGNGTAAGRVTVWLRIS